MKIELIKEKVADLPHMTDDQANMITEVILENHFCNILELGFRHGVSTCYMAGALDELGAGEITTIDLEGARTAVPNIEQLLSDLGLDNFVTLYYEPKSYTWRLMKMLEEDPTPRFDFCYIDGAHNWDTDGFSFYLVDRLLKPGGLIIFDDLDWTYESSPKLKDTEVVRNMPAEEKSTPQVRKIYELLVIPHPSYNEFMEKNGWAYARKLSAESKDFFASNLKHVVHQKEKAGPPSMAHKIMNRLTHGRSLK